MRRSSKTLPPRIPLYGLYAKLGVSPNASPQAIGDAYNVLERAYCPRGTDTDDAMRRGFAEIENAAALLRNPRTRWLYDRGYLDDRGDSTRAGRARETRVCAFGLSGMFILFGCLGGLIFNSWAPVSKRPAVSVSASAALTPAARSGITSLKPEFAKPIAGQTEKLLINPPSEALRIGLAEAQARQLEQAALASALPPEVWELDIWLTHSAAHNEGSAAAASPVLRTAQCRACLSNINNSCSKVCP
jgi:curved DNA-binding protein CbpA